MLERNQRVHPLQGPPPHAGHRNPTSMKERTQSISLTDGRTLAFAEFGDPNGKPLLYFHGTPGSRLEHHPDESLARNARVRVIAIDRPGYGLSDPAVNKGLSDWPDDVEELVKRLGLESFAVCGWSGGGPFVLACALRIPHRLTAAGVFACVSPLALPAASEDWPRTRRFAVGLTRLFPRAFARRIFGAVGNANWRPADRGYEKYLEASGPREREELGDERVRQALIPSMDEAFRNGSEGFAQDYYLLTRAWDFNPTEISIPVRAWHGTDDSQAPASMGRALSAAIPSLEMQWCEGEGHGLWVRHWPEMLAMVR
jgi:pimeloyl-ACP methyl ester carboxylesterase